MNKQEAFSYYASQLEGIRESGVLKAERIITTPRAPTSLPTARIF